MLEMLGAMGAGNSWLLLRESLCDVGSNAKDLRGFQALFVYCLQMRHS